VLTQPFLILNPPVVPAPPPPPPATTNAAILVAPAGFAIVVDVLYVAYSAYAATGVAALEAADALDDDPYAVDVVIVKVYEVPLLNPDTVIGLEEPVPVNPPGDDVTV
jgi:hypothetical protein